MSTNQILRLDDVPDLVKPIPTLLGKHCHCHCHCLLSGLWGTGPREVGRPSSENYPRGGCGCKGEGEARGQAWWESGEEHLETLICTPVSIHQGGGNVRLFVHLHCWESCLKATWVSELGAKFKPSIKMLKNRILSFNLVSFLIHMLLCVSDRII